MRIALVGAEMEENLAVRYIRGALEHAGHTVVQIVFNRDADRERATQELVASNTALAGFSMVFTYRAREFAGVAKRARELGYAGHIVAGGHFAAFNAESLLRDEPAFDSVGIGEGEELMADLAANLDDPASVRGLVWRDGSGRSVRNSAAVKPPDLDTLPHPSRRRPPDTYLGLPIVNMLSSRGCTHACSFCSIAAWHGLCGGARFRLRTPEFVAEEMAGLYHRGYRIFNFHDDNFFLRDSACTAERMRAIRRELDRRAVGRIAFAVKSRPDSVDKKLFASMKELGLFRVFLGIEAGTPEALRRLGRRRQTVEDNERALDILNALDIHTCFNLLLLNPDSTLEDFRANVGFLRKHPVNPMNFCRTEIYSGTPLERQLRQSGRLLGSYWGHSYRIGDERAQLAFELMNDGLFERHHAAENLHHMTMGVDYERQLLAHFFGFSGRLRRRTKDYIVKVNLDSVEYLEELAEAAGRGFASRWQRDDYLADLSVRLLADNRRLTAEGRRLLAEIRQTAWRAGHDTNDSWQRTAAAVGLAATLTLASANVGQTQELGVQVDEMAAMPPPEYGAGGSEIIEGQVKKDILPRIAAKVEKAQDVLVVIKIGLKGQATDCRVFDAKTGSDGQPLAVVDVKDVVFKQPGLHVEYRLSFSTFQLDVAKRRPTNSDEGSAFLIAGEFDEAALGSLAQCVGPDEDIEVEVWLNDKGAVTFAAVYKGMLGRTKPVELNAGDRKKVESLIKDLGAGKPAVRKKAVESLQGMGRGVLPFVRTEMAKTEDPEVRECCEAILGRLEGALDVPDLEKVLKFLRTLKFAGKEVVGKRFLVPVTKGELNRAKGGDDDGTYICEMAPEGMEME